MREWLTTREIAEAALPDVPQTRRGVIFMAEREGWDDAPGLSRERAGRGGGMEYSIRLLPTLAQLEWARRNMLVGTPANDELPAAQADTLTERGQRERDARLAVVHAFEHWSRGLQTGLMSRLQVFCGQYRMGAIRVDDWVRELIPDFSKRTLQRWIAEAKAGRTSRLAVDRSLNRKGTGKLELANDGKVRAFVLALMAHQPHLAAHHVRDQVEAEFGRMLEVRCKQVALPPARTFQRLIASLKASHRVALTKATNPDLYRSTMKPAGVGTLRYLTEPNALWMIDASPIDALCTDGRHSMYGCIDVATRRLVVTVSRTPRASAVALLIRKAILRWGAPQAIKTDNGSDFVARDTRRLLTSLGIETEVSDAYSPEQKGHIERAIRTFQHDFVTHLPGFVGHSVEDRKAIESRKSFAQRLGETDAEIFGVDLTAAELQALADRWATEVYEQRPHAGLKGQSPAVRAAASATPVRRIDERALDLLLMPAAGKDGRRTTTKFGVRIDGLHYQTPSILPGTAVFVRMDPMDAGRAYCFAADGAEFLGEAFCAELRGIDPAALQQATRDAHAEIMRKAMAGAAIEKRRLGKRTLIDNMLKVAASRAPNVVALPRREEAHTTPQIEAAIAAMTPAPVPAQRGLGDELALFHARQLAEADSPAANVTRLRAEETPHQRFRRALDVEARIATGAPVEDRELGWLEAYRQGVEYRSMKRSFEDSEGSMSL